MNAIYTSSTEMKDEKEVKGGGKFAGLRSKLVKGVTAGAVVAVKPVLAVVDVAQSGAAKVATGLDNHKSLSTFRDKVREQRIEAGQGFRSAIAAQKALLEEQKEEVKS